MTKDFIKIYIKTDFLTLGQLLKLKNLVLTGGEAKTFLKSHKIEVNKIPDDRRGKKLYVGDQVVIDSRLKFEIAK